jgi:hypothetical protein
MLPFVTILAALVFFLFWRWGILDDLNRSAPGRRGRWKIEKPRPKTTRPPAGEREDRLEVFQKFIEKLSDEDDQDPDS